MGLVVQNHHGSSEEGDQAIKVGVIDSGCGPHPALDHVTDFGSYIDGEYDQNGGLDSGSHGTHVCGTIGARGQGTSIPFWGCCARG